MNQNSRNLKFANIYKIFWPLAYNPKIGTEASVGESLALNRFLFSNTPFHPIFEICVLSGGTERRTLYLSREMKLIYL